MHVTLVAGTVTPPHANAAQDARGGEGHVDPHVARMLRCSGALAQVLRCFRWERERWACDWSSAKSNRYAYFLFVFHLFAYSARSQRAYLCIHPMSCPVHKIKKRTELTKVFFLPNFLPCMYLSDFRFCQQLSRSCSDFNVEELRLLCIVLPVHRDFVNYLSLLTEILKYTWGVYYFILFYKRLTNYFPDLNTRLINILFII